MEKIVARALLAIPAKEVWNVLPDIFTLIFDDGKEIVTTRDLTFYSRYIWIVHETFPNTPLLYRHYVEAVTGDKPMDSGTHTKLITVAQKDTIEAYGLITPQSREKLQELAFKIPNLILNEVYQRALPSITTVDITDFTELDAYLPVATEIAKVKSDDPYVDTTIRKAYDDVLKIVMTDKNLDDNNLVAAVRCGMVSANQFVQCSVVRGKGSYKTGLVMSEPILTNFTRGMYRLFDILAEGQSAAKAMDMQEDPLKDAEYFARRLQLLTMSVRGIHMGDCGSRSYTPWRLQGPKIDNRGKVIYRGDLENFVGKYYLDEENSTEEHPVYKVIAPGDKHLIGKLLYFRTAYRCMHHNKYEVCSTCFGDLAYNVSRFANLGHICAATMTQQTSQSVLSTKHLDASAVAADIELSSTAQKIFTTNSTRSAMFFRPDIKKAARQLIVSQSETVGLIDVKTLPWDKVNPNRVSELTTLEVTLENNRNETVSHVIDIKQSSRSGIFTIEFLEYLREKGWTADSKNMFVIDLDGWDFTKPVLKFPDVEYSYSDHSKQIADLIELRKLKGDKKASITSPDVLHQELFRLVNSKLNVASSCLEVIIYALMVDSPTTYGMGRGSRFEIIGDAANIIRNRSLSTAYGYEMVADTIKSPDSFFNKNRPNSPFDALVAPYEVVEEIKNGLR